MQTHGQQTMGHKMQERGRPVARVEEGQLVTVEGIFRPGDWPRAGEFFFWTPLAPGGPELPEALYGLVGLGREEDEVRPALEELGFFPSRARLVVPLPLTPTGREPRSPLGAVSVFGMATNLVEMVRLLGVYPLAEREPTLGVLLGGASLAFWARAAKLALELAAGHRYLPSIRSVRQGYTACWVADLSREVDRERFHLLAGACPPAAHALSTREGLQVWAPAVLLRSFLDEVVDQLVRTAALAGGGGLAAELPGNYTRGGWESEWWSALTNQTPLLFEGDSPVNATVATEIGTWLRSRQGVNPRALRLALRLQLPPLEPGGDEAGIEGPWRLQFLLQAPDDPSLLVPIDQAWQAQGGALRLWNRAYREPQQEALAALGRAGRVFAPIERSLEYSTPTEVVLDLAEAGHLVSNCVGPLEEAGVSVLLPADLTAEGGGLRARLAPKATLSFEEKGQFGEAVFRSYQWQAAIGGESISEVEFHRIAALKSSLVRWRGHWIRVNQDQVASLATFMKRRNREALGHAEVLSTALAGDRIAEDMGLEVEVALDGHLAGVLNLLRASGFAPMQAPSQFVGSLRPYQERGLGWLDGLSKAGLGGCLADDMGLGKTIQVIAWLVGRARQGASLVVCPTSLLGNWRRELRRFAPELQVYLHYGPARARSSRTLERSLDADTVVITTYGTLRLDQELLGSVEWDAAIIDEAQQIKNPKSKQTRSVHTLKAGARVALSGTPIENRLSELWSILHYTTPGLLGTFEHFEEKVAKPIERFRNQQATETLQKLVRPFVLRRLKTDPAIISDLPEKEEMLRECPLTREQASLYQAKVDETLEALKLLTGVHWAAKVLSSLSALKQICNHPAHYLKERGPLAKRSGKLVQLESLVERFLESQEAALIFTQYAAMGQLLVDFLTERFGEEVLFLRGRTATSARSLMVDRFQRGDGPRLFVLSLKAGGTGLTLTRATQVVHYDRWWNPAVEDQATDRAYRIGQTQRVQVHKLVCPGTLEEKIHKVLGEKRELAQHVLGTSGDRWLTSLSSEELRDLLLLDRDALVSEEGDDL